MYVLDTPDGTTRIERLTQSTVVTVHQGHGDILNEDMTVMEASFEDPIQVIPPHSATVGVVGRDIWNIGLVAGISGGEQVLVDTIDSQYHTEVLSATDRPILIRFKGTDDEEFYRTHLYLANKPQFQERTDKVGERVELKEPLVK